MLLPRALSLGFLLAIVLTGAFLVLQGQGSLLRGQGQKTANSAEALPPALFPAFPGEGGIPPVQRLPGRPPIRIRKTPVRREVVPGGTFTAEITVENIADAILRNLSLEERFDASLLAATPRGEGILRPNLLLFTIHRLEPGERWSGSYTLTVLQRTPPQTLETTAFVRGTDVEAAVSASRMATSVFTVIPLPKTGVDLLFHPPPAPSPGGGLSPRARTLPRG